MKWSGQLWRLEVFARVFLVDNPDHVAGLVPDGDLTALHIDWPSSHRQLSFFVGQVE
jgi:hypothetical protein